MNPDDILTRARSAVGQGVRYSLGCGGYNPKDDLPARPTWRRPKGKILPVKALWCDCSGFLAWVLGRSRAVTIVPGMWGLSTDSVYRDAKGSGRLFKALAVPVAGCIAVYPDHRDPKTNKAIQGHVGIVADVAGRVVVDCSSSQDGVAEHVQAVFWTHPETIFCQYIGG